MSSANSFLSSTNYHTNNHRYSNSQTTSFSVQQQLNDLNSTRSSNSSCSTSHCLSNQCIECTTILSTRNLNSFLDQTTNSSHFTSNCPYISNSSLDNSNNDELTNSRILSLNIPVEHPNPSSLNIEIEDDDDDDDEQIDQCNGSNEQLEVFVGFYRPGDYQRETMEDDDDDDQTSESSAKSNEQKKDEQSTRELISDDDEGNEDQDFIEEDFGPNQDDENEQQIEDNENEQLNPNILDDDDDHHQQQQHHPVIINENEQIIFNQIEEDEDQGFGAQFNDDCPSSDDENNHRSNLSLNYQYNHYYNNDNHCFAYKKKSFQRSQSDWDISSNRYQRFFSLPNLVNQSIEEYEKIEHFIIDDQQPTTMATTTIISNFIIKKKQDDDDDDDDDDKQRSNIRKKKLWRKSSEEILEISNQKSTPQIIVDEAVRDVERHVMLWDDEHAQLIDRQSSIQQIVQYFQLNIEFNEDQSVRISSIRRELLLDYLQYRSEVDISANDLHGNLLQYPEFLSRIHCRFFPFWPPRDVDLLQWLSHWIKQGALPVAIMNMDHFHLSKIYSHHPFSSWQHRIIYGIEPRGIYLMNPIQIQTPQQIYEQLTVDSITYIPRQEITQRYNQSPMPLTALAKRNNQSKLFSDQRWRTMNVLGQVVNVLREDRQLNENETRNIPYRPTVTHVRIPSTCSSGILIFSKNYHQLINAIDLPLRS